MTISGDSDVPNVLVYHAVYKQTLLIIEPWYLFSFDGELGRTDA